MRPRKVLTLFFLVSLLGVGYYSMQAAPVLSDQEYSYHGETAWRTDVSEAREAAAAQDKPMLVYFWTTWCSYCEKYNRNVYSSPTVQNRLDEFVLLAVNLDDDSPEASKIQRQYNADYPPQHVAVAPDGTQLVKVPGYAPKDDFLAYLEQAQSRYDQR